MLIECCLKLTTTLATFSKVDLSQHVDRLRENFSHLMIPKGTVSQKEQCYFFI